MRWEALRCNFHQCGNDELLEGYRQSGTPSHLSLVFDNGSLYTFSQAFFDLDLEAVTSNHLQEESERMHPDYPAAHREEARNGYPSVMSPSRPVPLI
jgi:hypothetical protein